MQILLDYISWWYSRGLIQVLKYLRSFLIILIDTFSVKTCIFTFFAPWKRDVVSTEGLAIGDKFKVWGFNLLARFFGMTVKIMTLIVFVILFVVLFCFDIAVFAIWLLMPVLLVEGVVFGIMYLVYF